MSRIKLDLNHFKHLKSEGDTTTLQHKDGHTLTIANKALNKESRAQLEALSKLSKDSKQAIDKGSERHEAQVQPMAKGGKVEDKREKAKSATNDKKKSPQTIFAADAEDGVRAAKAVRDSGEEIPDGATIVIEGKEQSKDYGKVKGPKSSEKPKVFAEGGEVADEDPNSLGLFAARAPQQGVPAALADTTAADQMLQFDPTKPVQAPEEPGVNPEIAGMDPALARKREIYNESVAGNSGLSLQDPKLITFGKDGQGPQQFDPNAWAKAEQMFAKEQSTNAANAASAQQQAIQINEQRAAAGLPPIQVPNVPQGPQIPGSPTNLPQPQADQLPNPLTPKGAGLAGAVDNVEGMMHQGYQQQMQGIQKQAAAQRALGQDQSKILQERQNSIQDAQIAYKRQYDELEAERQAHMQDIRDAHIDPNKYWTGDKNGNGSHSKIASAIGMIIAGFNPTNQPNAAINLLKQQMEMNLQAQKENLGSEQNLLSANLRQFGNLKDASDMTRMMQSDMVQAQLQDAAAKAQTPMARAAALSAAGQLQMQTAPMFQQFAMRRAMLALTDGQAGGDPSNTAAAEQMIQYARMTNPEMAKEMEGRLVPGVGMAKIPVPEGVRKELVEKTNLDRAAQDLLAYSKKHTNLIPGTPEYNYGATKALALQQKVREGMLGGVFKEGEKPLLEKFVNENPAGALKSFSTQPQLKAIIESNRVGLDSIKRSVGLPITPYASVGGESNGPVKGKDGKMYIRQGNYMVPYKAPKGK